MHKHEWPKIKEPRSFKAAHIPQRGTYFSAKDQPNIKSKNNITCAFLTEISKRPTIKKKNHIYNTSVFNPRDSAENNHDLFQEMRCLERPLDIKYLVKKTAAGNLKHLKNQHQHVVVFLQGIQKQKSGAAHWCRIKSRPQNVLFCSSSLLAHQMKCKTFCVHFVENKQFSR